MLKLSSNESHIEVLSLSRDLDRIAQCFFRDGEPQKQKHEVNLNPDPFQIESTLAALAEECRQTPEFEYICPILVRAQF